MPAKKKQATGPIPPTAVKVNNKDESADMATKTMTGVHVSAKIDSSTSGQGVRLKVIYSSNNFVTHKKVDSDWTKQGQRAEVWLPNLKVNTEYKARLYTIGHPDHASKPNDISFWTNRRPTVTLVTPAENSEYDQLHSDNQTPTTLLFDWQYVDPDDATPDKQDKTPDQVAWQVRYKAAGDPHWSFLPKDGKPATGKDGKNTFVKLDATDLAGNTTYFWSAQGRDRQGLWSAWPLSKSFFIRSAQSPPKLVSPTGGLGTSVIISADDTITFTWRFRDPDPKNKQTQADLRWRVVGTSDVGLTWTNPNGSITGDVGWVYLTGAGDTPGNKNQWEVASSYFTPGALYEWEARTYDDKNGALPGGWSTAGQFVAAIKPGSANTEPLLDEETEPLGALGCGHHRVFVYDRPQWIKGQGYVAALRGEIKPLAQVQWGRKRDDISNCLVDTNGFDQDCCELLGSLQSWVHELVIYRDHERVFEGPITRITYTSENVQIEAKDVMAYLYRRVIRQGFNDAYRRIDLTPNTPPHPIGKPGGGPYEIIGTKTVVERALQIAVNALAYQDPNVLPYLTAITYSDDAPENRAAPDYSKTAWEVIDDLAANGGLDYVTVGRRITFWDTHRTIGRLPEMRDGDFSDPVIVTEYGMELSNWYAVTNGSGVAGIAYPRYGGHRLNDSNWSQWYGPIEMVSSAYGEQQGSSASTTALTPAQLDALQTKLANQAKRGIAHRYPVPVVVRVPDNTTLNPEVNLGINQIVPGVWVPLRATLTCRKLAQWQKLDAMQVTETEGKEAVQITMSPAPNAGDDSIDFSADDG